MSSRPRDDASPDPDRSSTAPPSEGPEFVDTIRRQASELTVVQVVLAITATALVVRLIGLGARPMHFDEARVGYWSLYYIDTGSLTYRAITHGPFIQLVNAWLFDLVGASDFAARLPVAIVGGLLPATALLYREHLRTSEVVALALFLAFNAMFVYYSRYLRSDMFVATFMFAGLGCLVRYYDTRRMRYLYGAGLVVALGMTAKENALVYLLTWIGATGLLVDHSLFPPRGFSTGIGRLKQSWIGRLVGDAVTVALVPFKGTGILAERFDDPRATRRRVLRLSGHAVGIALLAVAVLVFFYADRGAGMAGMQEPPTPTSGGPTGLWEAVGQPLQFPGYALDTLQGAYGEAIDQWGSVSDGGESESFLDVYVSTLGEELDNISQYAPALGAFALVGFLYERYATERPRNLVIFTSYCGLASLVGYSLQNDPGSGYWLTIHIVLPMTVPAAVGLSRLYRWGQNALADGDTIGTLVTFFVLFLIVAQAGMATVDTSYVDTTSESNGLVQYAQAEEDSRAAFDAIHAVSDGEGTDVVVYMGINFTEGYGIIGAPDDLNRKPNCLGGGWISSLPMPWYFGTSDASVDCERNEKKLVERVETDPPPMVITKPGDKLVPRDALAAEYTPRQFNLYRGAHPVTFWIHEDHLDDAPSWKESS